MRCEKEICCRNKNFPHQSFSRTLEPCGSRAPQAIKHWVHLTERRSRLLDDILWLINAYRVKSKGCKIAKGAGNADIVSEPSVDCKLLLVSGAFKVKNHIFASNRVRFKGHGKVTACWLIHLPTAAQGFVQIHLRVELRQLNINQSQFS